MMGLRDLTDLSDIRILVFEPDTDFRLFLAKVLEDEGYIVFCAENGQEAWKVIQESRVDLIISDIDPEDHSGLDLLRNLRAHATPIPFAALTSVDTTGHAVEALCNGAFSFIQKGCPVKDIVSLCRKGVNLRRELAECRNVHPYCNMNVAFCIPSEEKYISGVIAHATRLAEEMGFSRERFGLFIWLGLREAILNAIHHGNREDPDLKVKIEITITPEEIRMVIIDKGDGFDLEAVPDPRNLEHARKMHGRGVMLLKCYMDSVVYNEKGNKVCLVKHRSGKTMPLVEK